MKTRTIKFNLIENAKDSLYHAVEHLTDRKEPSPGDYKRVIVDIAHVIELILKERLRRVHPAFIFDKVDKYPALDAHTVTTEKANSRLRTIAGVDFDESSIKSIKACKKYRNLIEHYEFEIESKEARAIVGRLLSFIFDFSKTHLDLDFEAEFKIDDTWQSLIDIYDFWQEHAKTTERRLRKEGRNLIECPACDAHTFDLDMNHCAFCEHEETLVECYVCDEIVEEWDTETIEISDDFVEICNRCIQKELAAEVAFEASREN